MKIQNVIPTGHFWDLLISRLHTLRRVGYFPNLSNPMKLNEIILANKKRFKGDIALARRLTDKADMKQYLIEIGLPELIVPTIHPICQNDEVMMELFITCLRFRANLAAPSFGSIFKCVV